MPIKGEPAPTWAAENGAFDTPVVILLADRSVRRHARRIAGQGLGDAFIGRTHHGALGVELGIVDIGLNQGARQCVRGRRRGAAVADRPDDHTETRQSP